MSAVTKEVVAVAMVAALLAVVLWWLSTIPRVGDYPDWVIHKEFLRSCDPRKTSIHVWNLNVRDERYVEYDIPRKQVPAAISKLLDVRLSRWSDAPSDDMWNLHLVITCDGKRGAHHIYGWSDRPPYFSRRARSEAGPWFASFAKKK